MHVYKSSVCIRTALRNFRNVPLRALTPRHTPVVRPEQHRGELHYGKPGRNWIYSASEIWAQTQQTTRESTKYSSVDEGHHVPTCVALSLMQGTACVWLSRGQCPARYGAASVSREDVRRILLEGLQGGSRALSPRFKAKKLIFNHSLRRKQSRNSVLNYIEVFQLKYS